MRTRYMIAGFTDSRQVDEMNVEENDIWAAVQMVNGSRVMVTRLTFDKGALIDTKLEGEVTK